MTTRGRIQNSDNDHQGKYKRVLCVCSAGLLRSPTAALILSTDPFNFNTRSAGIEDSYALIPVDIVLLVWADEIICMDNDQARRVRKMMEDAPYGNFTDIVHVLNCPDNFGYRNPQLMRFMTDKFTEMYLPPIN